MAHEALYSARVVIPQGLEVCRRCKGIVRSRHARERDCDGTPPPGIEIAQVPRLVEAHQGAGAPKAKPKAKGQPKGQAASKPKTKAKAKAAPKPEPKARAKGKAKAIGQNG